MPKIAVRSLQPISKPTSHADRCAYHRYCEGEPAFYYRVPYRSRTGRALVRLRMVCRECAETIRKVYTVEERT